MVEKFRTKSGSFNPENCVMTLIPDPDLAGIIVNHLEVTERNLEFEKDAGALKRLEIAIKHLTRTRLFVEDLAEFEETDRLRELQKDKVRVSRRLRIALRRVELARRRSQAVACCQGSRSILVQIARLAILGSLCEYRKLIDESKRQLEMAIEKLKGAENWRHVSNIRLRLASIHQLESFMDSQDRTAKLVFSERILKNLPEIINHLKQDLSLLKPLAI